MGKRVTMALSIIFVLLITASWSSSQEAEQNKVIKVGHKMRPEQRDFSESLMKQLKLPSGFQANVFAKGVGNPRMMAVASDGTVYVTRPKMNDVIALRDHNGDGRSDEMRTVVSDLEVVHGITFHKNRLYLAAPTRVLVADIKPDGTIAPPRLLIDNLPPGKGHKNRTIAFGPDGMLYISVGSSCNVCVETSEEYATVLRAKPDGKERNVYARGLRNTVGFAWHPETGEPWGMDNGSDWRGDNLPPEELNQLREGGNYGWPFCYGNKQVDKLFLANPKGTTKEEYCPKTVPSVLNYQAHSAPVGMAFYNASQFPEEYRGDAFVAMRGSWNRKPPTGYKVVRIRFRNGKPVSVEDFLTGFLIESGEAQFARIAGVAIARDGSLLISDDTNSVIYRVSYTEKGQ